MPVEEKVKEIIAKRLSIDIQSMTSGKQLITKLGGDSIDLVEIAMDIEAEYGIDISDDDIDGILSIGDIVCLIEARLS